MTGDDGAGEWLARADGRRDVTAWFYRLSRRSVHEVTD